MLNHLKISFIFFVMIISPGCIFNHWTTHEIALNPQLNFSQSDMGAGKIINLIVLDERRESSLGYQWTEFRNRWGKKGLPIKTNQNVKKVITASLIQGLKQKGFSINEEETVRSKNLRVEIRNIKYFTTDSALTGSVHVKADLKAFCNDETDKLIYEKYFREENDNSGLWITPSEKENEKYINDTISNLLEKVFQDEELLQCLAN